MGSHSRTLALSYSRTVSLALRSSPGRAVAGGQAGPGGHVVRRLYRRTQSAAADGRRGSDRGVVLRRRRGGADVLADRREEQQQASGQAEVYLLQGNWYVGFLYVHRGEVAGEVAGEVGRRLSVVTTSVVSPSPRYPDDPSPSTHPHPSISRRWEVAVVTTSFAPLPRRPVSTHRYLAASRSLADSFARQGTCRAGRAWDAAWRTGAGASRAAGAAR